MPLQQRRLIAACAIAAATLSPLGSGVVTVGAQETMQEAREAEKAAREEAARAAAQIDVLQAEDEDLQAALDAINELIEAQESAIEAAELAVTAAKGEAAYRQDQFDRATVAIDAQRAELTELAIDEFIAGPDNDTDSVLFETEDFSTGVRRSAYLDAVTSSKADHLDRLRALEAEREDIAQLAEQATLDAEALTENLEEQLAVLTDAQGVQQGLVAEIQNRIREWEQVEADYLAEADEFEDIFNRLREEERRNAVPDFNSPSAQGYIMPTAGSVGSPFGSRVHPIYGTVRQHNGIDVGGAMGQGIFAAKGGEVIFAGVKGGYGNAVLIDHGGGFVTLYAHMSVINVSVGTVVAQGDKIGEVGSTGLSTGPHLHFEVRAAGKPVDPMLFL